MSRTALVVVDVLSTYDHADADRLAGTAREALPARHSIFFETPLAYLLDTSGIERVVLCGQVTEQCILYSALDAYVRHFEVAVATDAVAAIDPDLAAAALQMMERNMHAELTTSEEAFAGDRAAAPARR